MRKNKRPSRAQLLNGAAFTRDSLRDLLAKKVTRENLKVPGDAEIDELVRILNGWKQVYLFEQNTEMPLRKSQNRGRAALNELKCVFLQLNKMTKRFEQTAAQDGAPATVRAILTKRMDEIKRTLDFVSAADYFSILPEHQNWNARNWTKGWKWLAGALLQDFLNAVQPANPTFEPGIGHSGPVARFIVAVVPEITGEHPTLDSVATQLKAHRKRGK